jgi:hypothetical protein
MDSGGVADKVADSNILEHAVTDESGTPCAFSGAEFEFVLTSAGTFEIHAEHEICLLSYPNDLPVPLRNIRVLPDLPSPHHTIIGGPGLAHFPWIIANCDTPSLPSKTYFSIVTCDRYQNACLEGGALFDVMLSGTGILLDRIEDNGDGTYEVWYGADALMAPNLLQKQRKGIIEFPADISISVLLNGVPVPQSPLLPTGMKAVAKDISSHKSPGTNLAVRFLMENAASSLHSFDLQQRCLRALASFTLAEVETVTGAEDARKVYTAAWKMVVQRGRSRRHSTNPVSVAAFKNLRQDMNERQQQSYKSPLPESQRGMDLTTASLQDTTGTPVLRLPGASKKRWSNRNWRHESSVNDADTGVGALAARTTLPDGRIVEERKATRHKEESNTKTAWCASHRRISLFENPSRSHWVGVNEKNKEKVSTAMLRRKEYDAKLRKRREAARAKRLANTRRLNSVTVDSQKSDLEPRVDALILRENRHLKELLKESPSDAGKIHENQSALERLMAQQRDIDAKHATLFNLAYELKAAHVGESA